MPKVIDSEGNEREISMEEFQEALRGASVTVKQQITHADGSVTSSVIYGNNAGDGVDHSLNIFSEMSDVISAGLFKAKQNCGDNEDAEIIFSMDNSGAAYEITQDVTDTPLMHVFTCTEDKVHIARYIRDERKSTDNPMEEAEYAFDDGRFTATLEEIKNDNLMAYAFGIHAIRCNLEERGILQELKEYENKKTGVIIAVDDDGNMDANIVRGRSRPDLPCMMFGGLFAESLDEAEMMRPYVDELLDDTLYDTSDSESMIEEAENGDIFAMEKLADIYLNGNDDMEPDSEKCIYWTKKAAENGSSAAMYNMGIYYIKGEIVERNFAEAKKWLTMADENGDFDAEGALDLFADAEKTQVKAEAGDPQAQADYVRVLTQVAVSLGFEAAHDEAYEYAQKSAAQGNGDGIWMMGLAYQHGRGVEADMEKAAEYYAKGAEIGHASSQQSLGVLYLTGEGVEQSDEKGIELFLEAAERGNALAMSMLGKCYQFGMHVEEDMAKAIEWYEKSLEVEFDPELAQKVAIFKELEEMEENGFSFDDEQEEDEDLEFSFDIEGDILRMYNEIYGIVDVVIPDSVVTIDNEAFCSCDGIRTVKIPESVVSIGDFAFQFCNTLQSIEIPESVTSIGEDAFDGCDELVITAPAGSYAIEYAKENDIAYKEV